MARANKDNNENHIILPQLLSVSARFGKWRLKDESHCETETCISNNIVKQLILQIIIINNNKSSTVTREH